MEKIVLAGWEAHGFRTLEELDVKNIMEEAKARWLRPNEIYAILSNCKYFSINVEPVNLPKSGAVLLFDRKRLKNFRKDGHNWKKKKGSRAVHESHERLKVGNEESIHVYYAHGDNNPTFVRRCYWLLDKDLESTVLVHYRETQEFQGCSFAPLNPNSGLALSDHPSDAAWRPSDETDPEVAQTCYTADKAHLDLGDSVTLNSNDTRLREINLLEVEKRLAVDDSDKLTLVDGGLGSCLLQQNQCETNAFTYYDNFPSIKENSLWNPFEPPLHSNSNHFNFFDNSCIQKMGFRSNTDLQKEDFSWLMVGNACQSSDMIGTDCLQCENCEEMMSNIITDSPGSVDESNFQSTKLISNEPVSPVLDHSQSSFPGQIFTITDVSPAWAFSTEETKILITGFFSEGHPHLANNEMYCVCGDVPIHLEIVQCGVFRCFVSKRTPGLVDLFLSLDGRYPISQVLHFEYRASLIHSLSFSSAKEKSNWDELRVKLRLACLLFSHSKCLLSDLSSKVLEDTLNESKTFASRTSHVAAHWARTMPSIQDDKTSFQLAKDQLFELSLMNRLYEWLLERIIEGCKSSDRDDLGQGLIHLCAILDYWWAIYPYAWSGMSLDYRDRFGWTALHWAASYGREKMAATLLSAGAKPYLVTDPTPENPSERTAADLAFKNGHVGLAAYLAEKALLNHFEDMALAGNISGSLQTSTSCPLNLENANEEELCLKDSLTACWTAANAAARIHAAFRERSFKLRTKVIQFSDPEDEVHNIVAAMKIQHAFRNYKAQKSMAAAARIQDRFHTWKIRNEFPSLRQDAVKIQANFRGFQVRKQYRKIVWSVGVLEKAILRWRMKRKGFRGLKTCPVEAAVDDEERESVVEEPFFQASRKQAEDRIERSVVQVHAIIQSKIAQQDYRRMTLAYDQARLDNEGIISP